MFSIRPSTGTSTRCHMASAFSTSMTDTSCGVETITAPVIGNGTGSNRGLFERAAEGSEGLASAEVVSNPHNQTLNVAVQWGVLGVIVLYAMWIAHLMLFRGEGLANWIGLLVVVQNIFTSLFNSHIFDFHEGWMYVLGTGVAGGMVLNVRAAKRTDTVGAS